MSYKRERSHEKGHTSVDIHGRIGRLDDHTLSYYRRVNQTLINGFSDDNEEKELFLKNVFTTLSEEALQVSQNQTASNIIEQLLREGDLSQLTSFGTALSKDWELACTDRFASHVTQTFLLQLGISLSNVSAASHSDEHLQMCKRKALELVTELYSFLVSNLAFHMQNTYTSHIVRVMLEVLAGHQVSEEVIRGRVARRRGKGNSKDSDKSGKLSQVGNFPELLMEICGKITGLNKIKDHVKNNLSNPVLQTILLILREKSPHKCDDVCRDLIANTQMFISEDEEEQADGEASSLPELIRDEIGSHFVEQILSVASEPLFDDILRENLSSKLLTMAVHPVANFVLQKLIKSAHTSVQFEAIYKKLYKHLETILGMDHPQVIVSLAEGCLKHGTKQDKVIKALMKAFHCQDPAERQIKCVPLFASLTVYETFYKTSPKGGSSDAEEDETKDEKLHFPKLTNVNFHGSLLLQKLFLFGNPKAVLSSFLQMRTSELKSMSCDPCGSHVIDAFMKSSSIGEKSRDMLHQRLKGSFLELACHKHGSRTLDNLYDNAPMRHKLTIVEELSKHEDKLRGDYIGRIIYYKYNVSSFLRNKDQWKQIQSGKNQKRKMFDEIFSEDGKSSAKKKKKKNTKPEQEDDDGVSSLRIKDSDDEDDKDESVCLPSPNLKDKKRDKKKSKFRKDGKPSKKSFGKPQSKSFEKDRKQQGQGHHKKSQGRKDKMDIIKDKDMRNLLQGLDTKTSKKKKTKT